VDRPAIAMIVGTNVLTLAIALKLRWPLLFLLVPFWIQSVVIGIYSGLRILKLENAATRGIESWGSTPDIARRELAKFFAMHYGVFHAIYLMALLIAVGQGKMFGSVSLLDVGWLDIAWVAAISAMFAMTHRASYQRNLQHDRKGSPNAGTLMYLPYARILPMHVTMIAGLSYSGAVLLFVALKTVADVLMHCIEHRILAQQKK
jgi:hypothetical protein